MQKRASLPYLDHDDGSKRPGAQLLGPDAATSWFRRRSPLSLNGRSEERVKIPRSARTSRQSYVAQLKSALSSRRGRQCSASAAVSLLACLVLVIRLVWIPQEPLHIPKREWEIRPYRHLNFSEPNTLTQGTRVFHVAKEFGPATMGGLGVMLTALSVAQAESPLLDISIIMPHYTFLRGSEHHRHTKPFAHIKLPITSSRTSVRLIGCQVSLLKWAYTPMTDFLNHNISSIQASKETIKVYLIGPGDEAPFHVAFKARNAGDIYSAYKPLKQEWKDLWFAQATSQFIEYLNGSGSGRAAVDVVHLHGATNAMVAYYLRSQDTSHRPAIVYTLHDSLDEVEYSNLVTNTVRFLPPPTAEALSLTPFERYILGRQIFPSALGIDLSDVTTFVSRSIARDIVEGRFRFSMQDLVMPSIARQASQGAFVGVTNGLDYTDQHKNPFIAPGLVKKGVSFPRIGRDLVSQYRKAVQDHSSSLQHASFAETKIRAKRLLVRQLPHLFSQADLTRPLLLFIGRFQYNKGCEFFEPVLETLSDSTASTNGRLVVMGARNNYPIGALRSLVTRYPDHITLIDDTTSLQQEHGTLIRMASDFAFVPSFSEAFGLVAAEGLLFGMRIISSGVGGLREFLRPDDSPIADSDQTRIANAIVFKLYKDSTDGQADGTVSEGELDLSLRADQARPGIEALGPAIKRCQHAVSHAITVWNKYQSAPYERELVVRTMISDALELEWNRRQGPVDEYTRVYKMALRRQRRDFQVRSP